MLLDKITFRFYGLDNNQYQKIQILFFKKKSSKISIMIVNQLAVSFQDISQHSQGYHKQAKLGNIKPVLFFSQYNIQEAPIMPNTSQKKKKQQPQCVICATRKINCKTIECNHQFCYRCLSKWGRRKGNCPLCRTNIRQIQYKNKIISPDYLLEFDQRIIFSSDQQFEHPRRNNSNPEHSAPEAPVITFFIPFIYVNFYGSYVQS